MQVYDWSERASWISVENGGSLSTSQGTFFLASFEGGDLFGEAWIGFE
jgi:hypothetical protein